MATSDFQRFLDEALPKCVLAPEEEDCVKQEPARPQRLIDANAMRQDWLENGENEYVYDTNAVLESIDAQPTVDAVEVVHGHWTTLYKVDTWMGTSKIDCFVCSECGKSSKAKGNYCPDCGAKMDGGKDNG